MPDKYKIITECANKFFYIHNGGVCWGDWRVEVNDRVRKIKEGEKVKKRVYSKEEIEERLYLNNKMIEEFNRFSDYLYLQYFTKERLMNK